MAIPAVQPKQLHWGAVVRGLAERSGLFLIAAHCFIFYEPSKSWRALSTAQFYQIMFGAIASGFLLEGIYQKNQEAVLKERIRLSLQRVLTRPSFIGAEPRGVISGISPEDALEYNLTRWQERIEPARLLLRSWFALDKVPSKLIDEMALLERKRAPFQPATAKALLADAGWEVEVQGAVEQKVLMGALKRVSSTLYKIDLEEAFARSAIPPSPEADLLRSGRSSDRALRDGAKAIWRARWALVRPEGRDAVAAGFANWLAKRPFCPADERFILDSPSSDQVSLKVGALLIYQLGLKKHGLWPNELSDTPTDPRLIVVAEGIAKAARTEEFDRNKIQELLRPLYTEEALDLIPQTLKLLSD